MSDLKPCPFCGGEIGFDFEHDNFLCSGCWAIMPYSPNGETVNTRPIEDKLQAEIERLKSEMLFVPVFPQWIPVSERLPEYNDDLLFVTSCAVSGVRFGYYDTDNRFHDMEGDKVLGVTHWMSLPEPPEAS